VTSPKEADAGAVGLVPEGTKVADATSVARIMGAAMADMGSAADAFLTDEGEAPPEEEED
jgi:hypothetical protein